LFRICLEALIIIKTSDDSCNIYSEKEVNEMRKATGILFMVLLVLCMTTMIFADLNGYAGRWVNIDPNTRGITALNITVNGTQVNVQAWGSAHPRDIDWGVIDGYAYAATVSDNLSSGVQVVSAAYRTNFSETTFLIRPQGRGQLSLETLTRFTDNSGRANYHAFYQFSRHGSGNEAPVVSLEAPRNISPSNGAVFHNYPRTTVLKWEEVNGAASYTVEVDYNTGNEWITNQGKSYIVAPNITSNFYTFDFIGAQGGRWRVWAVDANGHEGPKSGWWIFRYTK
jgi:hypothetical protein